MKYYPSGNYKFCKDHYRLTSCDHPFVQNLINRNMHISYLDGELTLSFYHSWVMLYCYPDSVRIALIAVEKDYRGMGAASGIMWRLMSAARATNTTLTLCAGLVRKKDLPPNAAFLCRIAAEEKGRKTVEDLVCWYSRLGFDKSGKNEMGQWEMIFKP